MNKTRFSYINFHTLIALWIHLNYCIKGQKLLFFHIMQIKAEINFPQNSRSSPMTAVLQSNDWPTVIRFENFSSSIMAQMTQAVCNKYSMYVSPMLKTTGKNPKK